MRANHFVALSFLTALASVSVMNSNQEVFQPIRSVEPASVEVAAGLQALVKYEMVDSLILSQAIKSVKDFAVKQQLLQFKRECELRIKGLEILLHKLGVEVPSRTKNATSYLMQGFVVVRGLTGDKGVLKALRTNEKKVLSVYERALENNLPGDIRPLVQGVYDGVSRHVQYLEDRLGTKIV